jgi:sugar lactone lactonase YvrE
VLRSPKLAADGLAFSPDGEFLAVAERHDCKVGLTLDVEA